MVQSPERTEWVRTRHKKGSSDPIMKKRIGNKRREIERGFKAGTALRGPEVVKIQIFTLSLKIVTAACSYLECPTEGHASTHINMFFFFINTKKQQQQKNSHNNGNNNKTKMKTQQFRKLICSFALVSQKSEKKIFYFCLSHKTLV